MSSSQSNQFWSCRFAMSTSSARSKMTAFILLLLVHFAVHIWAHDEGLQTSTSIVFSTTTDPPLSTTSAPGKPEYDWYRYAGSRYFTAFAFLRDSPIHLEPVTARNFSFWLGGPTVSYCPEVVAEAGYCDPGNYTAFSECTMVGSCLFRFTGMLTRSSPFPCQVASTRTRI